MAISELTDAGRLTVGTQKNVVGSLFTEGISGVCRKPFQKTLFLGLTALTRRQTFWSKPENCISWQQLQSLQWLELAFLVKHELVTCMPVTYEPFSLNKVFNLMH